MQLSKSKKSQSVFLGIMISIMVFLALVGMIPAFKDIIIEARNPDNMDCDNTSITTGEKASCILVDFWMFYFIGVSMAGGIAYITGKKIGGF